MDEARKTIKRLAESQADGRAYWLASHLAEEFIRCNGVATDVPNQFVLTGADITDDYSIACIEHLKWVGEAVAFEQGDDLIVMLGDYTLESLA